MNKKVYLSYSMTMFVMATLIWVALSLDSEIIWDRGKMIFVGFITSLGYLASGIGFLMYKNKI